MRNIMNLKKLKNYLVITLLALVGISASAQTAASAIEGKKQTLFSSANHASTPYRIPAIATLINGDILAISDQRPCGADIGHGEVDIYAKVSKDNGATWTPSSQDPSSLNDKPGRIADGTGNTSEWDTGFGDAAVVVDRESGNVLVVCVAGNVVYGSSSGHNKMAQIRATFNKTTGELNWQAPEDKTSEFFKGD
jgi:sialidase-1